MRIAVDSECVFRRQDGLPGNHKWSTYVAPTT